MARIILVILVQVVPGQQAVKERAFIILAVEV
jgi:hypothetical protein